LDWLVRQAQSTIHQVQGGLYLSGLSAIEQVEQVRALGIGAVVRLDKAPRRLAQWPDDFALLDVPLSDGMGLQAHHVTACLDFIRDQRAAGQGVLVHCQMGMSRSVVMVMGHLVRDEGLSLGQAYHLVRRQRPIAAPNPFLVRALIQHLGLPFEPDSALGLHFLQDLAER
jgi:atypical dual specificity phosphatase